jgi:signal peptidase II
MIRAHRLAFLAYGLAIAVIVADQALKYWILDVYCLPERLADLAAATGTDRPSIHVMGPFQLSLVWNRGVSFGFMNVEAGWTRWALTVFSLIVAAALAVWAWRVEKLTLAVAVGLIMGGAIGNAIDRIRLGAVADFVDVSHLYFPWVFNVADSAISVGIVLLLLDMLIQDSRERAAKGPRDKAQGDAA